MVHVPYTDSSSSVWIIMSTFHRGMKRAVIFDVGGVLITAPQPVIAGYEKELGLPKCVVIEVVIRDRRSG